MILLLHLRLLRDRRGAIPGLQSIWITFLIFIGGSIAVLLVADYTENDVAAVPILGMAYNALLFFIVIVLYGVIWVITTAVNIGGEVFIFFSNFLLDKNEDWKWIKSKGVTQGLIDILREWVDLSLPDSPDFLPEGD